MHRFAIEDSRFAYSALTYLQGVSLGLYWTGTGRYARGQRRII